MEPSDVGPEEFRNEESGSPPAHQKRANSCQADPRGMDSWLLCDCEDVSHALSKWKLSHKFFVLPFSLIYSAVSAFVAPSADRASTALAADRREFLSAAVVAAAGLAVPGAALAVRDYENIGFLGGSDTIDINNANVRVYLKLPGMYPNAAGKIAANGPYNSVSDIYNIPGLTNKEKEVMKKYESKFTALTPSADYVIDRINNGLYVFTLNIRFPLALFLRKRNQLTCPFISLLHTVTVKLQGMSRLVTVFGLATNFDNFVL